MAQEYKQLKLENQLCFPLYACSRKIISRYTSYLKPLGLTYTQYVVFMVLWDKEKVTVGELGETLYLDAGTLTPLLKKLEKEGYIHRERSGEDERVTYVSISDKGNELKEKCKNIPSEVASLSTALSEKEAKELYRLLYLLINENVQE
ncbi:MAG: MarR family transcriptional regulator [Erysipelotrichaceae bacterium]|nr:MarR family transcriptional regulator [Erysipelotrichaceae bacterium]